MTIILHMVFRGQNSGLTFFSNVVFFCIFIYSLIYLFVAQTGYKGVRFMGTSINEQYLQEKKMHGETIVGGFTVYERKLGTGYRNF